ncbi:MAG: WbqC family protein, partial [Tatlockia sp.]|nr:WbqC family protein [Tatlockia sp.]
RYSQVFEDRLGFQPNLSILDLLFCEGPNAINLLTSIDIEAPTIRKEVK